MIYRIDHYENEKGQAIRRRTNDTTCEVQYFATGIIQAQNAGQQHHINFNFEIIATSIEDAFAKLEEAGHTAHEKAVAQLRQQMMAQALTMPAKLPPLAIAR